MTKLSGNWFESELAELRVSQARDVLTTCLSVVVGSEMRPVEQTDGRILAEDIYSPRPLPAFDHAAVDGFALRFVDLQTAKGQLPVVGRVSAGERASPLTPNTAMQVLTGAPVPAGADTVVMWEDVRLDHGRGDHTVLTLLPEQSRRGKNIRRVGEEAPKQTLLLPVGRRIGPCELGLLASLGLRACRVRKRLRVALLSTGNELVGSAEAIDAGWQRYDANRPLLASMMRRLGCRVTDLGVVRDDLSALQRVFGAAAEKHDLVLSSGGVSAGEEDHVLAAIQSCGQAAAWKLALKPGRALAMGTIAGVPIISLPGNPVAAFNVFLQIARPAIMALSGAEPKGPEALPVRAAFHHKKRAGRLEVLRVKLGPDREGHPGLHLFCGDSSGWLTSLTDGDGVALLAEDIGQVTPGDIVNFLPFKGLI